MVNTWNFPQHYRVVGERYFVVPLVLFSFLRKKKKNFRKGCDKQLVFQVLTVLTRETPILKKAIATPIYSKIIWL